MNGIQNYGVSNYQPSFFAKGNLKKYGKLAKYIKVKKQPAQPQYTKKNFIQKGDKVIDLLLQYKSSYKQRVGHEGIFDDLMRILNS